MACPPNSWEVKACAKLTVILLQIMLDNSQNILITGGQFNAISTAEEGAFSVTKIPLVILKGARHRFEAAAEAHHLWCTTQFS